VELKENTPVTGRVRNSLQAYCGELSYQLNVVASAFDGGTDSYAVLVTVAEKGRELASCLEDDMVDFWHTSGGDNGLVALRAMQQVVRSGERDVKSEVSTARAGVVKLSDGRSVVVGLAAQFNGDLEASHCERVVRLVTDNHLVGYVREVTALLLGTTVADTSEPADPEGVNVVGG